LRAAGDRPHVVVGAPDDQQLSFDRRNVDRTVAALVASQDGGGRSSEHETAKKRLADAEKRLRRFQDAIAAGIDPGAVVDAINEAQAQRAAAQAELQGAAARTAVTEAEVYAMIDSLGDVGAALKKSKPESLERLYRELRLELRYQPRERAVDVQLAPRVVSACVRWGTRAHKKAPPAQCRCSCPARYWALRRVAGLGCGVRQIGRSRPFAA